MCNVLDQFGFRCYTYIGAGGVAGAMELSIVQVMVNLILAKASGTLKAACAGLFVLQTWQQAPIPSVMAEFAQCIEQLVEV